MDRDAIALPSARDEAWRYTAPRSLVGPMGPAGLAPVVEADVTSADGVWSVADVGPRRPWDDGFEGLLASCTGGALRVSESARVAVTRGAARAGAALRVAVTPGSSAVLVARHVGAGDGLQLADLDVEVPAGARLVIVRSVEGEGRHLGRVRADVSGTLEVLSLVDARGTARVEVSARLGASARFDLGVLVRALDGAHVDHHAEVFHDAPGAVSRQVARGIVHDGGRSAFTGRVEVAGGAMGTDARQSVRHLLLGSRGRVDARPWLAIRCDDVVCTHGATVGRLDAEALFLMRSRGLTEADARGLLLGAFAREVLERLPDGAADLGRVSSWD